MDEVAAGNSAEQRAAEVVMLATLAKELGVPLAKKKMVDVEGAWTELDGVASDPPTLVEVWAHQGLPKSAQKAKVMTDALKLVWVEAAFFPAGAHKILLLSDPAAAAHFRCGPGWPPRFVTSASTSGRSSCRPITGRPFVGRRTDSSVSRRPTSQGGRS